MTQTQIVIMGDICRVKYILFFEPYWLLWGCIREALKSLEDLKLDFPATSPLQSWERYGPAYMPTLVFKKIHRNKIKMYREGNRSVTWKCPQTNCSSACIAAALVCNILGGSCSFKVKCYPKNVLQYVPLIDNQDQLPHLLNIQVLTDGWLCVARFRFNHVI